MSARFEDKARHLKARLYRLMHADVRGREDSYDLAMQLSLKSLKLFLT